MLQNLPYFWNTKTHIAMHSLFHFSFRATLFFSPNECPGLCRHRPGHSLGKNKVARNEKQKKTTLVFIFQKYGKF